MAAASTIPIPAPLKMSANLPSEWKRFKGQWNNYLVAAKLVGESSNVKAAIFLACVGTDAYELFQTFVFDDDNDQQNIDKIVDTFERHCVGEVNKRRTNGICSTVEYKTRARRSTRLSLICVAWFDPVRTAT